MGLFFGKKKLSFSNFPIGVFGKLPFYKDFLYSSFGEPFSDLRDCFDAGFDGITRAQHPRPYVSPARRMLVYLPKHRIDLVLSIWESDDGLRCFPFILAAPFPKKYKTAPFPHFWQALECFWDYFERYYQHLAKMENPADFYKNVRGLSHSLPDKTIDEWPEKNHVRARQVRDLLEGGRMAPLALSDLDALEERDFLRSLSALRENPNFLMWPSPSWRDENHPAVYAYFADKGLEDLNFEFFLPEKPLHQEPEAEEQPKLDQSISQIKPSAEPDDESEDITDPNCVPDEAPTLRERLSGLTAEPVTEAEANPNSEADADLEEPTLRVHKSEIGFDSEDSKE